MPTYRVLIDHEGAKSETRAVTYDGTAQELYDSIADEFIGDAQLAGIFVEESEEI